MTSLFFGNSSRGSSRGRGRSNSRGRSRSDQGVSGHLRLGGKVKVLITLGLCYWVFSKSSYSSSSGSGASTWSTTGAVVTNILSSGLLVGPTDNPDCLRALVRNVTTDMDQLITVFEEFLETQENSGDLKASFRTYLGQRASSSFVSVERTLDSILWVYKLLLPFLLISLLSNAFGSGQEKEVLRTEDEEDQERDQDQQQGARELLITRRNSRGSTSSARKQKMRAVTKATGLYTRAKKKSGGFTTPASVIDQTFETPY